MKVMRISGRKLLWVVGIFFALINFGANAQMLYNYVQISNPDLIRAGSLGSDLGAPSLNENGRVAFGAFPGIFSGDGSETELSDYTAMAVPPAAKPIFYGSYVGSRVIFSGTVNGKQGVFNSDGVNIETIVIDPTFRSMLSERPLMNSTRQFAYVGGDFNSGKGGVYIAQNGTSNAVYTIPTSTARGQLEFHGVFDSDLIPVQIGDSGDVFFNGVFSCLPSNPPRANDCTDEVEGIIKGGTGNPPTLLVPEGTVNAAGDFVSIDGLWVSHSGLLAYVASTSDDTGLYYRLVKANNPVTDTRSGPFESFGAVAINNGGSIVFFAEWRDTAGKHHEGLFNGPDLVRNKIIALGDPLFDSTVVSFAWHPVGFNDAGQIAFLANLASGKSVAVRADPLDGTTAVEWVGPGAGPTPVSGLASIATNWKPVNGDPPRVPIKNAALSDTALFDRPDEYRVDLNGQHAERLVVKNGHVTFKSGQINVDALSFERPSVVIDNARLTLAFSSDLAPLDPAIICNHALIGGLAAAKAELIENARWVVNGSLRVGGPGEGRLSIQGGGDITSAESRIGGAAGGHATIGFGGHWTTGNFAIGIDGGAGDLTIENGGQVISQNAVIGQEPSLGNVVTVQGGTDPLSTWSPARVVVGSAGTGRLNVTGGGRVFTRVLEIAANPGVSGSVRVSGVGADRKASQIHILSPILIVGENGVGELQIEDGGNVEVSGPASISYNGSGTVTVSGVNAGSGLASRLSADGSLLVGPLPGSLVIDAGGLVESQRGSVSARAPSTRSEARIIGSASDWVMDEELTVGNPAALGGGSGVVTLVGGAVDAETVTVEATGVVQGFGALRTLARVINSGTISPGLSPGTLEIRGNYEQTIDGRLLIEIGGANSEAYDHLIITNSVTLDGTLELRFISGFAPKRGDTFNFLHVGGALNNAFATVEMKNLGSDFQFNISTNGTNIALVALNDGTFVTPLQGQISSSNVITVGGISYLPYTLHLTNDCSIVEVSDSLRREGQELFQKLTERSDPACGERSANVSRILPLGALPPGNYQFHFMLDGVAVYDASFSVPADTGELLKVSRISSGELKLEISGLPGVLYTIQASADLRTWSNLPAHVGTFLGPYSVLEPVSSARARFYRVKIE